MEFREHWNNRPWVDASDKARAEYWFNLGRNTREEQIRLTRRTYRALQRENKRLKSGIEGKHICSSLSASFDFRASMSALYLSLISLSISLPFR